MRKLLEIRIDGEGRVSFSSEYRPLKGMNLYQMVFVALMFEPDRAEVARWLEAIRILGLADVCASKRPEISMKMFESTVRDLKPVSDEFKRRMGGNLNFALS
ncbi:MAG: hypothetical protein K6F58_05475 [Bacteroidales bacterium]|nr:hypothetical protein [Bacteroidales bacterium]